MDKLRFLQQFGVEEAVQAISPKVLLMFRDRARSEGGSQMHRHPSAVKHSLLAVLFHARRMEVTDHIVKIFLELIRRIQKKADKTLEWDLIKQQYDEIVKHVVAVVEGTGPIDSILRRFNSYNRSNPTYRACIELGKALKTIFLFTS